MLSAARPLSEVSFPEFTGTQIYMKRMRAAVAHLAVPQAYRALVRRMLFDASIENDQVVWLTIDESHVKKGKKHRRGGAHVDGCYEVADWGGDGPSGWLNGVPGRMLSPEDQRRSYENQNGGMIIASNFEACRVWLGEVEGVAGLGGDCEHLRDQFDGLDSSMMEANRAYLTNSTCIHESLPLTKSFKRQLVRITLSENYQYN